MKPYGIHSLVVETFLERDTQDAERPGYLFRIKLQEILFVDSHEREALMGIFE
jgi:hypothetical protein